MAKLGRLLIILALVGLAVVGGDIAYKSYQRTEEANTAEEALREKAAERQSEELTFASQRQAILLRIDNLKTEDRIAELDGRARQNLVPIAQLEGILDADDTYKAMEYNIAERLQLLRRWPEVWGVMHHPLEVDLEAIIQFRRANLGSDENAKKHAEETFRVANQYALDVGKQYEKVIAAASQGGK
ncbi:MAG TPA: hypothetical protein VMI10_22585 [Terriglobales bacterium]|nr:hypothetical protein [Terriglobales bacterium]